MSFLVPTSRTASFCHLWGLDAASWLIFLRQVSLYWTNLLDKVLWVSAGFSTQPDSAQSKNLSRQWRPDSSSSALPRSCLSSPSCCRILFAIVSVQLVKLKFWTQQRKLNWLMLTDEEDCSTHHVWNSLLSIRVSLLDFCLWHSFLSLLRYPQKCTASRQIGKTSLSARHDQHCSDQNCRAGLEPWHVVLRDEFPRTWSLNLLVRFGEEWNTSITNSKDREREFHPCANLHREK